MGASQGLSAQTLSAKCVDTGGIENYRIVALHSSPVATQTYVTEATASTAYPFGVVCEPTDDTNGAVSLITEGVAEVQVLATSTNIAVGDLIVASTGGKGAKAPTNDATARFALGVAMEPSTADDDVIRVKIDRMRYVKGTA